MDKFRLVYLEWVDSIATNGWQPSNFIPLIEREMVCKSFGFIYSENDYSLTITTSLSFFGSPMDPLQIPKVAIREMFEIPLDSFIGN